MSSRKNVSKTYLFEEMPIPKAVMTLAVPTVISSLVMVLYNMADTYFVGMMNDPICNAAVTLAAPVPLAFNAVNNLFGVGTSSMMSRALGAKDHDLVRRSSAFGFYCSLFFGTLIMLGSILFMNPLLTLLGATDVTWQATKDYMFWIVCLGAVPSILNVVFAHLVRAEGDALHASIGAISGCLLNIILDPFFILPFGLGMGAAGAGLATFLSNCVATLYFLIYILRKRGKTFVCIDPRMLSFTRKIVFGVCAVGIPASIQNLLNVTGMTILNNFTAGYGPDAVAAMGISQKVNSLAFFILIGASQGIMPMVSYNYASGNSKRMKSTVGFYVKFMAPVAILFSVLLWTCSAGVIHIFIDNAQVIAYGARFLKGFALVTPFLTIDFLGVGVYQALGMGQYSLLFAVLRKIILEIPAIFILNHFFPLYGLAYSQFCAEFVLGIAAAFLMMHIFKKAERQMEQRKNAS